MEKDISCKWKWKESWDSNTYTRETIKRDKEGHYIVIEGSIQQEDITMVNIYVPNIEAPKYIKQI